MVNARYAGGSRGKEPLCRGEMFSHEPRVVDQRSNPCLVKKQNISLGTCPVLEYRIGLDQGNMSQDVRVSYFDLGRGRGGGDTSKNKTTRYLERKLRRPETYFSYQG